MRTIKFFFCPRFLALFLTVSLTLSSPAFALRTQAGLESTAKSGLEAALQADEATGPPKPIPRVGLEEPSAGLEEPSAGLEEPSAGLEEPSAGLEEAEGLGLSRRDILRWGWRTSLASVAYWAGLSPEEVLAQRAQAPVAPKGSLAPLAERLGSNREIAIVVWDPRDLSRLPSFFKKAVPAGVTTVWVSGYRFAQLASGQQQAILNQANAAGLRTLGFIDGNYDWALQGESVAGFYDRLTSTLLERNLGKLRIAFATDVEPYTRPKETGWNGDLSGYSNLLERVILPKIQGFTERAKARFGREVVVGPRLTRFEPFWYKNGNRTDEGYSIRGLRDFPETVIAAMTYRNTAAELAAVSTDARIRAQRTRGVGYQIGTETLPGREVGGQHLTFEGRETEIAATLLEVLGALPEEDEKLLNGVFIHFRSPVHADRVLDEWLAARPVEPEAPKKPEKPAPGKEIEVAEGSLKRTHTQLSVRLKNVPKDARAVFLLKTDRYYWQPREGASVAVGADGTVTGTTVFSPPNWPGWLKAKEAVILLFASSAEVNRFLAKYPREIGLGWIPRREDIEPKLLEVIRISQEGQVELGALIDWSLLTPLAGPIFGPDRFLSLQHFTGMQLASLSLSPALTAGQEEAEGTIWMPVVREALVKPREFLGRSDIRSVLPYLVSGEFTGLEEYFGEELEYLLEVAGYDDAVPIGTVRPFYPVSLKSPPITLFAQPGWETAVQERIQQTPWLTLVKDPKAASFVIADAELVAQLRQQGVGVKAYFLRADSDSIEAMTPAFFVNLMAYIQHKKLSPGSILVVGDLIYNDLNQEVIALTLFV